MAELDLPASILCNGTVITGGALVHAYDRSCPVHGPSELDRWYEAAPTAMAAAEARGRQWAIDALRDDERFWAWANGKPQFEEYDIYPGPEDFADYLEHLAAHPDHSGG